ncbi:MAG: type II toxin-antitoxin system RelE/ParE family toxin [Cyclobacteriaceae bacterium]
MADKKIVWTETAANQRNSVLKYWVKRNKSNTYSLKLLKLSNDKTLQIAQNPKIYRQSEFPETRVASMGHFSIYYKIDVNVIIITAFWDNRQDPKRLLQELRKLR